jgi:hypothetical protein
LEIIYKKIEELGWERTQNGRNRYGPVYYWACSALKLLRSTTEVRSLLKKNLLLYFFLTYFFSPHSRSSLSSTRMHSSTTRVLFLFLEFAEIVYPFHRLSRLQLAPRNHDAWVLHGSRAGIRTLPR